MCIQQQKESTTLTNSINYKIAHDLKVVTENPKFLQMIRDEVITPEISPWSTSVSENSDLDRFFSQICQAHTEESYKQSINNIRKSFEIG